MFNLKKTIGVWGDSILKGVVFDEKRGDYQILEDSCAELTSRHLGLVILNRSRYGCTVEKGSRLLAKALEKGLDCAYVLLEYGGNDCDFDWPAVAAAPEKPHQPRTPLPEFRHQLHQMIDLLRFHQIEPLLMSLPPINGMRYLEFLVGKGLERAALLRFLGDVEQIYRFQESYSLAVTTTALQKRCFYIPIREAFLAHRASPGLLCSDGIHPNEEGHQLMYHVFSQMAIASARQATVSEHVN